MWAKEAGWILAAMGVKITTSVDDVLWLMPFVASRSATPKKRVQFGILYIFINICMTSAAIGVSKGSQKLVRTLSNGDGYWDADRILGLISTCLLTIFSMYLCYEELPDILNPDTDEDEEDVTEHEIINEKGGTTTTTATTNGIEKDLENQIDSKRSNDESDIETQSNVENLSTPQMRLLGGNNIDNIDQNSRSVSENPPLYGALDGSESLANQVAGGELSQTNEINESNETTTLLNDTDNNDATTIVTNSNNNNNNNNNGGGDSSISKSGDSTSSSSSGQPRMSLKEQKRMRRLLLVAIFGSFDEFAVQCAVLLADTFLWYQLMTGVFLSTFVVISFCLALSRLQAVVDVIEKVPLFVIIGILAIYTGVSTFEPFA